MLRIIDSTVQSYWVCNINIASGHLPCANALRGEMGLLPGQACKTGPLYAALAAHTEASAGTA